MDELKLLAKEGFPIYKSDIDTCLAAPKYPTAAKVNAIIHNIINTLMQEIL